WHGAETNNLGVELLSVPASPATTAWPRQTITQNGEGEAISAGGIDGDGDLDIFQGSHWLRNDGSSWTQFQAASFPSSLGIPDRNILRDIDGDGDLDAVVGFKHPPGGSTDLVWLQRPSNPTALWTIRVIRSGVGGGYSLDAADLDRDGDVDVVLGEHEGSTRLLVFENQGGGASFTQHIVHSGGAGIDHHLGARLFDVDGDGDLDIVSIGWHNPKLWIFENRAIVDGGGGPSPDVTPPSAPTNLTASAISSAAISLTWSASTDDRGTIASYRIFRNATFVGSSSTPSFVDSGLAPETSYTYRVSARDPSGNESPLSSPASATTPQSSGGDPVLFAGWAFEETSGTAINDSSGNGRHGTLVSPATRNASGRFGRTI